MKTTFDTLPSSSQLYNLFH